MKKKTDEIFNKLKKINSSILISNETNQTDKKTIGIKYGTLGQILFLISYNKLLKKETLSPFIEDMLISTYENINQGTIQGRSFEQIADFGWFIENLNRSELINFQFNPNTILEELDVFIEGEMEEAFIDRNYDIIDGVLCAGYYFLNRSLSNNLFLQQLRKIILWLEEISIAVSPSSIYWISKSFPDEERIYLGISHGSMSIVLFLDRCAQLKIEEKQCRSLMNKAINYILEQEYEDFEIKKCFFPVAIGFPVKRAPLEWCYGDLSIGLGLLKVSNKFPDKTEKILRDKAHEIMSFAAKRKNTSNAVVDASLVHGASGAATIFREMFKLSKNKDYLQASYYWTEETLKYSHPDNNYAGFKPYYKLSDVNYQNLNLGFASGISGIGLNYIAYLDNEIDFYKSFLYI